MSCAVRRPAGPDRAWPGGTTGRRGGVAPGATCHASRREKAMRRGKLIGLGVGPGDPELMTMRGVRALEKTPAIAFIAAAGRASRAREIAASYIRHGTRELIAVMPMSQDPT